MSALLNSSNAHNLPIFQPILMILVSKFMVYRVLSGKTCLILGLLSPTLPLFLMWIKTNECFVCMKDTYPIDVSSPSKYKLRYNKEIKPRKGLNSIYS